MKSLEDDPETELPDSKKSRNRVEDTMVLAPRSPTSVRKQQMRTQEKMKLGVSHISRKIGNGSGKNYFEIKCWKSWKTEADV